MSRQFLNPYKCHTTPPSLFCLYESRCRPSSHFHQLTDYNTSACGARITTDDVAGSICEPPADKLRNYCPYSDSGSGYRALNTFISDLLSNQSTSLYAYIYIYIYVCVCVSAPTMYVYTHNPTTCKSKTLYKTCALLVNYTAYSCNSLQTPTAVTDSLSRHVGKELQLYIV